MKKLAFFVAYVISCITVGTTSAYGSSDGSSSNHDYMAAGTASNSIGFTIVPCVYTEVQPPDGYPVKFKAGGTNCVKFDGTMLFDSITLTEAGVSCLFDRNSYAPYGLKVNMDDVFLDKGYVNLGYFIPNTPYSRDAEIKVRLGGDEFGNRYSTELNSNPENVNLCTSPVLCDTTTQKWLRKASTPEEDRTLYLIFKI